MDDKDWFEQWYEAEWRRYNDSWERFMREYVFSPDPPFKNERQPTRILGCESSNG